MVKICVNIKNFFSIVLKENTELSCELLKTYRYYNPPTVTQKRRGFKYTHKSVMCCFIGNGTRLVLQRL